MRRTGSWAKAALGAGAVFAVCMVVGATLLLALGAESIIFEVGGRWVRELAGAVGWGPLIGAWTSVLALPALAAALAVYERMRRGRASRLIDPPGVGRAELAAAWHRVRRWVLSANEAIPWKLALLSFSVFYVTFIGEQVLLFEPWSPLRGVWDTVYLGIYRVTGQLLTGVIASALLSALPFASAIAVFVKLYRRRLRDTEHLRCLKCGYILKGLSEPRCPECGEHI